MFSDKCFGLSGSLIAAVHGVLIEEKDKDSVDAKKIKGGKTKVDLEPKTDDDTRDYDDKKSMKEGKEHTTPKTDKEKKLASLASPKDKITHKDVLVGRGVLAKEEKASDDEWEKDSKAVKKSTDPEFVSKLINKWGKRGGAWLQHPSFTKNLTKEEVKLDEVKLSSAEFTSGARRAGTGSTEELKKSMDKKRSGPGSATIRKLDKAELKRRLTKEEVDLESLTEEDLEEVLKKSQPAGEWIKDFVHSDDPKFAGKSKKQRMQMALGAYYAKQHNEEVEEIEEEQLDELKKSTLGSYIKKAAQDRGHLGIDVGAAGDTNSSQRKKDLHKMKKRMMGIHRASDRLTKEELERIEAIAQSLDEDKPTIVSAPIRGANQDQSGENTKSTSSAYTISDSKKMRKEEVELDEAKRGRPKKNPTPDDEQDEHEHVIMQLRKVVSTHGALPVKHLDGKSTKITPQLAQHALNKHAALKTAAEKQDFEQKLHKSHDSMKSALG